MNPTLFLLAQDAEAAVEKVGDKVYSVPEAIGVALFTWAVVFTVLFLIFVIIRIFGAVVGSASKSKVEAPAAAAPAASPATATEDAGEEFSSGTLKLKGCDEKTAAMIMAIVSDNTGIPLNELIFKSITLVEEK